MKQLVARLLLALVVPAILLASSAHPQDLLVNGGQGTILRYGSDGTPLGAFVEPGTLALLGVGLVSLATPTAWQLLSA